MKPDNVIAIATRFAGGAPVELLEQRYDTCRHEHTYLDAALRTVGCSDCGEERLDPFEVLAMLAKTWRRWHHEAEQLRKLRAEWQTIEQEKWARARDRHLTANPSHTVTPGRSSWSRGGCRICYHLEVRWNPRWEASRAAPEPPPGKLEPA